MGCSRKLESHAGRYRCCLKRGKESFRTRNSVDNSNKKLLIVAYAFPPHSVVGSMRPLRMVKYLQKMTGWKPMVLTVDKDFARKDPALLDEIPSNVNVYRSWTTEPAALFNKFHNEMSCSLKAGSSPGGLGYDPFRSALKKISSWLMEIFSMPDAEVFWNISVIWRGFKLMRKEAISVLLVTSPPWSLQISGYFLKRLTGVHWVVDFRDPWTDIKRKNRPVAIDMLEQWMERKLLSYADLVLSTSDTYTNDLRKKYPAMDKEKFQTLHNGYDEDKFHSTQKNGNNKFTIVHLGSLYSQFNPDILFDALMEWMNGRDGVSEKIELLFIGEVTEDTREALRERKLLSITRITGYLPHEEAIKLCYQADILLLALGTNKAMPSGWLPSKLFEYLAVSRPILAYAAEGEAASMVRSINKGFVVTREDKAALIQIFSNLFNLKWDQPDHFIPWTNDHNTLERLQQPFLIGRLGSLLDSVVK